MSNHFDLIIIGGGPSGYKTATTAAGLGATVALIDKSPLGLTWLTQGYVANRAIRDIAKLQTSLQEYQQIIPKGSSVDFIAGINYKNKQIASAKKQLLQTLQESKITCFVGTASFIKNNQIIINTVDEPITIGADKIIIATGAQSEIHPALDSNEPFVASIDQFTAQLSNVPKRLLCVGSGITSCELAFALQRLGSQVTIAEQSDHLLSEPFISAECSTILENKLLNVGVNIKKQCNVLAQISSTAQANILFDDATTEGFDLVLQAIGRTPNTLDLNLENIGVELTDVGFIKTNKFLETNVPGIYAVGDVKQGLMTVNSAFHDANIASHNALNGNQIQCSYETVPTFIDSEFPIARIGISKENAQSQGFNPADIFVNESNIPSDFSTNSSEGFVEIVYDQKTYQVLGGSVGGHHSDEMINIIAAACRSEQGLGYFGGVSSNCQYLLDEVNSKINIQLKHIDKNKELATN